MPCKFEWKGRTFDAHFLNYSMIGACVSHPTTVPQVNSEIDLTLVADHVYHLRGRVVHESCKSEESGGEACFGIEFEPTPDHARYCMFVADRM
jgi:hypothetical protein